MEPGQEIAVEIDPGKIIEIRLQAVGETNEEGDVRVFFELNGQPRTVRVPNRKAQAMAPKRPKAEAGNPGHVAAPMPGVIASVAVGDGPAGAGGRPDPDHRGDEDGDRALRRPAGHGEGAARPARRAGGRQGPAGRAGAGLTAAAEVQRVRARRHAL